jgi:hypothetical protein
MGLPILPTGICMFWDSESNPDSGWTEITGKENSLIVINSSLSPGSSGGGSNHTHPVTGSLLTSSSGGQNSGDGNPSATYQNHGHSCSATSNGDKSFPNYVTHLRIFQKNSTTSVSSFPTGAIIMYDSGTPPTGWSSFVATGNGYIKLMTSGLGLTWYWSHGHTFGFYSGYYQESPVGQSDSGTDCPSQTHRHYVSGSSDTETDTGWEVSRIKVKFIKKTGTTRFSQTPHYLYCLYYLTGSPGGSWEELTSYNGRYLKMGSGDISTSSASGATHTHTVTNGQSGYDIERWGNGGYHAQCITHHTHTYSLSLGNGTHNDPAYVTFRLFRIEVTSFSDIGIRYRNAGVTYKVGAEDLLGTHKVRISYGGVTYGIPLLSTSDPDATPIYVYDGAAVKALASIA